MGDKRVAIVNAEYEFQLYEEILQPDMDKRKQRSRESLEFMFFFMNEDPNLVLQTEFNYSQDYFDYLKSLGVSIPDIVKDSKSNTNDKLNWFGKLENLEVERKLNSKIWMYEFLSKMRFNQDVWIINDRSSLSRAIESISNENIIIKDPYLMSGINMEVFNKLKIPKRDFKYSQIIEPYYQRIIDLAYFYNPFDKEGSFYINQTTTTGQYVGAIVFDNQKDFLEYIDSLGLSNQFEDLKLATEKVVGKLEESFKLEQLISFDSFIYERGGEKVLYPLCDINYRVNMGALVNSLRRFLPAYGVGQFILIRNDLKKRSAREFTYDTKTKKGIIYLTPENSRALGLFICSDTIEDLGRLRKKVEIIQGL